MAFKDDSSFLKYVTMGALGARAAQDKLNRLGHHVIELERNCCSNKIWRTKIKRLRLPDLMCAHCGQRFEVRSKTKLEIKMSHSPENPDRHWDAGMSDEDMVLFVGMPDGELSDQPYINGFRVGELRATQHLAKQGQRKSASEGAELDLTWPSWTPKEAGRVIEVRTGRETKVKVQYGSGRKYTYNAAGKILTVAEGDTFGAGERILASSVQPAELTVCPGQEWQPSLDSEQLSGKYTAAKALRYRDADDHLEASLKCLDDADMRVALEAAGTVAALNQQQGLDSLQSAACARDEASAPWAMEATFILAELGTDTSLSTLREIAASAPLTEVRAAAYWGLRGTSLLLEAATDGFRDAEAEVREHVVMAIASRQLGHSETIRLIQLMKRDADSAAGACEALRHALNVNVDALLLEASSGEARRWAFAVLAGRDPDSVRSSTSWVECPEDLKEGLAAAWFRDSKSWAAIEEVQDRLRSLKAQHL